MSRSTSDRDPERPWDEPGTETIVPGVHRVPLPMPEDGLRAVNCYLVQGPVGLTAIDPGVAIEQSATRFEAALQALGHAPADLVRVLVTHAHYDHYSHAVVLRRLEATTVHLGREEARSLAHLRATSTPLDNQVRALARCGAGALADRIRRAVDGSRLPYDAQDPDQWIDHDDSFAVGDTSLVALHTPGHTRGHVVFDDQQRGLLFAGDHVLPYITPSIGFEAEPEPLPLGSYLRSLQLVRDRPDARLLPAHGPVTDSVHTVVDSLQDHHADRLQATLDALAAGATTASAVAGRLRWTRRGRRLDELDDFNRMLAILETEAHLELLCARGTLRRDGTGLRHYLAVG